MAAPIKLHLNGIISAELICRVQLLSRCPMESDIELYNISFLILKVELPFNANDLFD